jgi:hypothetical protein
MLFLQLCFFCFGKCVLSSESARYCVGISPEEFECSDDPIGTRTKVASRHNMEGTDEEINRGLRQLIDGNDAEQKAIREILNAMDEYFFGEVLSKPEYDKVRKTWYVVTERFRHLQLSLASLILCVVELQSKQKRIVRLLGSHR